MKTERFKFGQVVKTQAVVLELTAEKGNLEAVKIEGGSAVFTLPLHEDTIIYGLGENLGGINKRGKRYMSYCTDDANHTEDKKALYGAHNFFILKGENPIGYFIDFPGRIKYDMGFTNSNICEIEISGTDFDIYRFEGNSVELIVSEFRKLIGISYLPPRWGFGYFQSRWGYRDEVDVQTLVAAFDDKKIPLEGVFLDLDYMEDYKDFSLSDERFSNFKNMTSSLKEQGVYLLPIIDAGVKIEKEYNIYEEGVAEDHFVKDETGKNYVAAVWPGRVHFPDFFQEKTRRWWGEKYKFLTDLGIEGIWNDMNEPAVFYDETSIEEAIQLAIDSKDKNLNIDSFFELTGAFMNLFNKDDYYKRMYHNLNGKQYLNDDVHNEYGALMTQSASEGLRQLLDRRYVLISRASNVGMHRYSGIWTGDNHSWWSHLEENIKMMPGLNMVGYLYSGADTGGFGGDSNHELMTRWFQFSAWAPFFRNHAAWNTVDQEPYVYEDAVIERQKRLLEVRYELLPYLYSEYMKAARDYRMLFKPLEFEYPTVSGIEDQLLYGESVMLAPVYKRNHKARTIRLPESMLKVDLYDKTYPVQVLDEGLMELSYTLDNMICLIKKNSLLPLGHNASNTKSLDRSKLVVIGYICDEASYELYDDDGISLSDTLLGNESLKIKVIKNEGCYDIDVIGSHSEIKTIEFRLYDREGQLTTHMSNIN